MVKVRKENRPWGTEFKWADEPEYIAKILILQKDKSIFSQSHENRKKTLCLWAGKAEIEWKGIRYQMVEGNIVTILPGQEYSIKAVYNHSVILEVSEGKKNDK